MTRPTAWRLATLVGGALLVPIAVPAAEEASGKESSSGVVAFLNGSLMTSRVTGDAPLPIGLGGEGALGVRIGATTIRVVGGGTSHHLRNGETLVLGDSLTVASDWSITWFGVDQQYYLRDDRPGGPFFSAGVAFAYLTHGEKDNVSGWRLTIGAGHEIAIHRMVSLQLAAEVDYVHAGSAKAAGKKIRLEEAFDEVALTARCGFTIYDLTGR